MKRLGISRNGNQKTKLKKNCQRSRMQTVAIDPRFEGAWNVLGNHLQKAKDVSKNVEGLNVFHMYHIASKTNPGSFSARQSGEQHLYDTESIGLQICK